MVRGFHFMFRTPGGDQTGKNLWGIKVNTERNKALEEVARVVEAQHPFATLFAAALSAPDQPQEQAVYVCPHKDRECGAWAENWCDECPRHSDASAACSASDLLLVPAFPTQAMLDAADDAGVSAYANGTPSLETVHSAVYAAMLAAAPVQPADPMDWPLPCDITVGAGTIKAGVKLRVLVRRMEVLHGLVMSKPVQPASKPELWVWTFDEERYFTTDPETAKVWQTRCVSPYEVAAFTRCATSSKEASEAAQEPNPIIEWLNSEAGKLALEQSGIRANEAIKQLNAARRINPADLFIPIGAAQPAPARDDVQKIISEIHESTSLARRDYLFEQLLKALHSQPAPEAVKDWCPECHYRESNEAATSAPAQAVTLTGPEIERGWHDTFSTSNPFCPCDLGAFTKAVKWAERRLLGSAKTQGDAA